MEKENVEIAPHFEIIYVSSNSKTNYFTKQTGIKKSHANARLFLILPIIYT